MEVQSRISACVVADSINKQGDRITTMEIVFPRFILAEAKTHRIISGLHEEVDISINSFKEGSKNSASSRAIPFKKMVEMVKSDPFVPLAFQRDHKGMQGTEYLTGDDALKANNSWVWGLKQAIGSAEFLNSAGVTKQLCNRLLEPFMWHKVLITSTEWENFFSLRCPQYVFGSATLHPKTWRSKKDAIKDFPDWKDNTYLFWNTLNIGQAEIHMMALAEAMWDARNESTSRLLEPGEWHIPYGDQFDEDSLLKVFKVGKGPMNKLQAKIQISTGMCARASYTTVGDEKEVKYETLIGIHDKMIKADPFHASPFEHCAQAMTQDEYDLYVRGKLKEIERTVEGEWYIAEEADYESTGWCRNFRGFRQYRDIIESK